MNTTGDVLAGLHANRERILGKLIEFASIPSVRFQRHMGLDTVCFSFSTADEDFHAPNEFFRMHRLHEGLEAWGQILGEAIP